jgi:hypothetical protein
MPGMAAVHSYTLLGIDALPVTITVDSGMVNVSGGFHDAAYKSPARLLELCESTLATARHESRLFPPDQSFARVLYGRHQAPAELPKQEASFDLQAFSRGHFRRFGGTDNA